MSESTGQTKDAGWEVGVRTTVAAQPAVVWEFLVGEGLPLWLGEISSLPIESGVSFVTADGVRGSIRSYQDGQRVRLGWQPEDWPHDTTLQLTVKEAATGTTVALHHERLADRDERRMMLGHWKNVIAAIDSRFA